jgi:3-methyl-2-oxobutanoate hydroxymethyltransferase
VKTYGNLLEGIETAVSNYAKDVKTRNFPTEAQVYRNK